MEGSITFNQLGIFILFLLLAGAGIYGIIILKKINHMLKYTNDAVRSNMDQMNRIIPNTAEITESALYIINEIKEGAGDVREAVGAISLNLADAVVKFNEAADRMGDSTGLIEAVANKLFENERNKT